ncbi:MAG: adenylate kinase [Candidatus Omnitrophica bacterium]|nr:adenylate kinase [Candidatus Omnitrophota bacterium]MDD5487378.1 adenylate kinase [Candidatus Omnitrophota bacterium]
MMKKGPFDLVLLGPPGAGKGTQAAYLAKAYGLLHISTGDMLRQAVKDGGVTGLEVKRYMEAGELVPDDIVTKSVVERMGKPDASSGVMLDGYPRNSAQAGTLDESLSEEGRELATVLYFNTPEEVVIQRLSGRRVCKQCGKNYHVTNMPSAKEGVCDICGGELIQRKDDNIDTIKNRLNVYKDNTADLISYYRKKGKLMEVDGGLPAGELFEQIDALFKREGLI